MATAPTPPAPSPTAVAAPTVDEDMEQVSRRRRRLMFGAILAGVSVALILGYFWKNNFFKKTDDTEEAGGANALGANALGANASAGAGNSSKEMQYAQMFDKSGDVTNPTTHAPKETPESLLKLATKAKEAGLMIQGVTQCGWTRRQREMFGGASSPARKVIESIYIECRDRSMCPNIRGYPTWVRGDQQYPGFKDAARLRALIEEVAPQPVQPMLQQASEPVEENIPEIKKQADQAPMPQTVKSDEEAEAALQKMLAGVESGGAAGAKEQRAAALQEMAVDPVPAAGEGEPQQMEKGDKVENVRGVSAYPPLAPPVMPGTAPFQLQEPMAANQMRQGNVPRLSASNSDPVYELAQQMASTFSQIASDQARNPNSSQYSDCAAPQSSTITTGEALDDKRIYTEIN